MQPERRPTAEVLSQFAFTEGCVNFAVANPVDNRFRFAALAFRYQVVLIRAGTRLKRAVA